MSFRTRLDPFTRERYVSAADLDPQQKRQVWAHVRENDPEQAAFLTDPVVAGFVKGDGFTPRFSVETVRMALGE